MRALDNYGRLGAASPRRWFTSRTQSEQYLFIDVDLEGISVVEAERLGDEVRSLPATVVGATRHVYVRWVRCHTKRSVVEAFALAASKSLARVHSDAALSLVEFVPGKPLRERLFTSEGLERQAPLTTEVIQRLREVEVSALLAWGHAVWRPSGYHYRLPSGTHSDTFIRLADAIRTPRDALVLASWLLPDLKPGVGVVVDSASLTPVLVSLQSLMSKRKSSLGVLAVLESYPLHQLDALKAFRDAARGDAPVIGLVSVSATGAVADRMLKAILDSSDKPAAIHLMVDKSAGAVEPPHRVRDVCISTWHAAGGIVEEAAEDCGLCRSADRSRYVQIDPRSFAGMVLPAPDMVMPSANWALKQKQFWELADSADAIVVEGNPDVGSSHPRHGATKRMSVKIDFDALLDDDRRLSFAEAAWWRLAELDARNEYCNYDAVVVDVSDMRRQGFEEFASDVLADRYQGNLVPCDLSKADPFAESPSIETATRVLVFRLGAVSGLSLYQMLVAVQDVRRRLATGITIEGVVCHLRPSSLRQMTNLSNAYAGRLLPLWESVLPEDHRSPLQDELDALSRVDESRLPANVGQLITDRRLICADPGKSDPILWGIPDVEGAVGRLSPHSYYGDCLRARAAYAAIGGAMHHARLRADLAKGAPLWRQFEVGAIARSYYDPIILACIFRWARPGELWWGGSASSAESIMNHMIQVSGDGRVLLILELLLAAAEGKVPSAAVEALRAAAGVHLPAEDQGRPEIAAGIAVLDAASSRVEDDN